MKKEWDPHTHKRLSDYIVDSLDIAVDQEDVAIADLLIKALDLTMTRAAAEKGDGFKERRSRSTDIEKTLDRYAALKKIKE